MNGIQRLLELPTGSIIRISNESVLPDIQITSTTGFFSSQSREALASSMTDVCIVETLCDLSERYLLSPLKYRTALMSSTILDNTTTNLCKSTITFQVATRVSESMMQTYGSTLWLLHRPKHCGRPPATIDFKAYHRVLTDNSIFLLMKQLTTVDAASNVDFHPPVWPYESSLFPSVNQQMTTISSEVYFVDKHRFGTDLFNRNFTESGARCNQNEVGLTYVGRLTQFLKAMRMCSLPDLPAELSPTDDYNVCPIFDLIVKNQPFPRKNYQTTDDFTDKFSSMMSSSDPDILIVDGAPGTGKTSSTADVIYQHIRNCIDAGVKVPRILVTTPSNAAADVIFAKLLEKIGKNSVVAVRRTGERAKFSQTVLSTVENDEKEFRSAIIQREAKAGAPLSENFIKQQYLLCATIVVTTLGSSQSSDLASIRHSLDFDLLVIDECGQASYYEFLYPFYFKSITKLLLVGDPRQLGPVIKWTGFNNYQPHQTSIFVHVYKRMISESPARIVVLREQHRMRKFVAELLSTIAYSDLHGALVSTPNGKWSQTLRLPEAIIFSGDSWKEKKADASFSFENTEEMMFGLKLLEASLKQAGFDYHARRWPARVPKLKYAIICLYKAQVNLFNRYIKQLGLKDFVRVSTVDQMQGSEVDVAIVSAVRTADENGSVGFAGDLRRLTVALSRAACVYLLAKYDCFRHETGWHKLYQLAARHQRAITHADTFTSGEDVLKLLISFSSEPIYYEL